MPFDKPKLHATIKSLHCWFAGHEDIRTTYPCENTPDPAPYWSFRIHCPRCNRVFYEKVIVPNDRPQPQ